MLTELELSKKREKKNLKRRANAKGRATAQASYYVYRSRCQAKDRAALEQAREDQRAQSRAALERVRKAGKATTFEAVKEGLRAMLPRRTGGAD